MEYEIKSITATGNIGFKIKLNKLAIELENTEYEPEKFSGLIYKIPPATFLIYSSGKFLCVGCKNNKEIENSIRQLLETMNKFKENKEDKNGYTIWKYERYGNK